MLGFPRPSGLRIPRNPLAYPAGRAPGFNPSHVAGSSVRFSGIATAGTFYNLLNGRLGSVSGSVSGGIGQAGPFIQITSAIPSVQFTGGYSTVDNTQTLAAVGLMNNLTAHFFLLNGSDGSNSALQINASGHFNGWFQGGATNIDSGVAMVAAGIPYLLVQSMNTSNANCMAVNLNTGQIKIVTVSSGAPSSPSNNGNIDVGSWPGHDSGSGQTFAAMWSSVFLSVAQLLQWGADPWSFWYPTDDAFNAFNGTGASSSFLAAWALGRNRVHDGWAT